MTIKKFNFKKSYEEVEIAGEVYQIEFNDDKQKEYLRTIDRFHLESKRLHKIETKDMNTEEKEALYVEIQELTKETLEMFIGEGTYETVYEQAGRSTDNMIDVVMFVADVLDERMKRKRQDMKKKYVTKPKKAK